MARHVGPSPVAKSSMRLSTATAVGTLLLLRTAKSTRLFSSTAKFASTWATNRAVHVSQSRMSIVASSQLSPPHSFRTFVNGLPRLRMLSQLKSRPDLENSTSYSSLFKVAQSKANRWPQDASVQEGFYSAMLEAGMPEQVVERYNSGLYAKNFAIDKIYQSALQQINLHPNSIGGASTSTAHPSHSAQPSHTATSPAFSQSTLSTGSAGQSQAAAQAAVGHLMFPNRNTPFTSSAQYTPSGGNFASPLHVRVEEARGAIIFRILTFFLKSVFVTYVALVFMAFIMESPMNSKFGKIMGRKATATGAEQTKTRFSDVHGCDEAKEELQDIVQFLKDPAKFNTLGGKLPKGVLLSGPPGTGKTLLARAVAGEAGVPFFYMSGSEFDEVFVGVGSLRVRELFSSAKAQAPAIIFLDELDAVGSTRNAREGFYNKQTLNQLLTELDGFEQNSGVIVLAATNFPDILDKALTRPGRFDRNVAVTLPDVRGRTAILKHHATKVRMGKGVNLERLAQTTPGLSGAELANIINEAAIYAGKRKAKEIGALDLEWAKDKVTMGAERKTMVIDQAEKEMTAYHEAGHTLLKWFVDPTTLHKVTVLPRGMTLGHMAHFDKQDKYSRTAEDLNKIILVLYGGFAAEELVFGSNKTTTGVSDDIQRATRIAFEMVARFGMSGKMGPIEYQHMWEHLSATTKASIETAVSEKLSESYHQAKAMLVEHRDDLERLAQALLKYETLSSEEIGVILRGKELENRTPVPPGPTTILVPGSSGSGHHRQPSPSPPPVPAPVE